MKKCFVLLFLVSAAVFAAVSAFAEPSAKRNPLQVKLKFDAEEEDEEVKSELGDGTETGQRKTLNIEGIEFPFVWCSAGTFRMGSPESEPGRNADETLRTVTISRGFWILETPVTVAMWRVFTNETAFSSANAGQEQEAEGYDADRNSLVPGSQFDWNSPGFPQDENEPVTEISWFAAVGFCKWFQEQTDLETSLPTEAEWEYACRAGSETPWFFGDADLFPQFANIAGENDRFPFTSAVKSFRLNGWGLADMSGNVSQWCKDWYAEYDADETDDPSGPGTGTLRVSRGGNWTSAPADCRSARREAFPPSYRSAKQGFRIMGR